MKRTGERKIIFTVRVVSLAACLMLAAFPAAAAKTKKAAPAKAAKAAPAKIADEAAAPENPAAEPGAVEAQMLDSMLTRDFPAKSDFIAGEDAKAADAGAAASSGAPVTAEPSAPAPVAPPPSASVPSAAPAPRALPVAAPAFPSAGAASLERMAYPLLGVLGAAFALALIWRLFQGGASRLPGGGKLRLLAQQAVGPRSRVVIVEALGRKYMLGVTQENVQLLADLDFYEAEAGEAAAGPAPAAAAPAESAFEAELPRGGVAAADKVREKVKGLKKL